MKCEQCQDHRPNNLHCFQLFSSCETVGYCLKLVEFGLSQPLLDLGSNTSTSFCRPNPWRQSGRKLETGEACTKTFFWHIPPLRYEIGTVETVCPGQTTMLFLRCSSSKLSKKRKDKTKVTCADLLKFVCD